jgi:hypothetical protein
MTLPCPSSCKRISAVICYSGPIRPYDVSHSGKIAGGIRARPVKNSEAA